MRTHSPSVSGPGLNSMPIGTVALADVVKRRAEAEVIEISPAQAKCKAQRVADFGYVFKVSSTFHNFPPVTLVL